MYYTPDNPDEPGISMNERNHRLARQHELWDSADSGRPYSSEKAQFSFVDWNKVATEFFRIRTMFIFGAIAGLFYFSGWWNGLSSNDLLIRSACYKHVIPTILLGACISAPSLLKGVAKFLGCVILAVICLGSCSIINNAATRKLQSPTPNQTPTQHSRNHTPFRSASPSREH